MPEGHSSRVDRDSSKVDRDSSKVVIQDREVTAKHRGAIMDMVLA